MIKILIDGKEVEAKEGSMLIEVAREAGAVIPSRSSTAWVPRSAVHPEPAGTPGPILGCAFQTGGIPASSGLPVVHP